MGEKADLSCCDGIVDFLCFSLIVILLLSPVFGAGIYYNNYYGSKTAYIKIEDVYVPSLDAASLNKTTTTFNTSIYVDLKFEREAALTRLDYADFEMSLLYGEQEQKQIVGTHMVKGFSMERKRRVQRVKAVVEAVSMPWQHAIQVTSSGNVVTIVLQFKGFYYYHLVAADVAVDASGHMVYMHMHPI